MGNNIILETKFVADIRGSFYIPSYQRGYRWSETNDDDSLTDTVTISQNEAGIDTEDRIIKLKKYIANMK